MAKNQKRPEKTTINKTVIFLGITNFVLLMALVLIVGNGELFQAKLGTSIPTQTSRTEAHCESLTLTSLPEGPLPANTSALISVKTLPENFDGMLSFSASSGTFNDLSGNADSFIETAKTLVSYSGGSADSTITVQAKGEGNEVCIATLPIVDEKELKCTSLLLNVYPSPLPPNQSAEIKIISQPPNFSGTFLAESSDQGTFQIADADSEATGNNSNTVVTTSKTLLFSGGKANETITIRALGNQNGQCRTTFQVSKK